MKLLTQLTSIFTQGFIATNSTLGLVEVDAVRATSDVDELGDFLPHVRNCYRI